MTAKLVAGAALAILVAGTGVERFTASSGHRSPAGVRRTAELVTSTPQPAVHAPVYAPIALVRTGPASRSPKTTPSHSSDGASHRLHSSSSHGLVTVHKVTSTDGTTTTRVTTSGSRTVDGKTTQGRPTTTTVTPLAPKSSSSGTTSSSGHRPAPVTSPVTVHKPAPVSAPAPPSRTTANPAKGRRGHDAGG